MRILKRLEQEVNHLCLIISKDELQKNGAVRKKLIELKKTIERTLLDARLKRAARQLKNQEINHERR